MSSSTDISPTRLVTRSSDLGLLEPSLHHHSHYIGHGVRRFPPELSMRFRCIALAAHDIGWPFQVMIQLDVITPIQTQLTKGRGREIRKAISRSGRNHEVVRFRMLQ